MFEYKKIKKVLKKLKIFNLFKRIKRYSQNLKNYIFLHQKSKIDNGKIVLIIARYNEKLNWLKNTKYKYIVYNKGKNDLPFWIKNIKQLPNIGREADTYLNFIIDNYDNLPNFIGFLQGNPFDHSSNLYKKLNAYEGKEDYLNLSDKITVENKNSKDWEGIQIFIESTTDSAKKLFNKEINNFEFSTGAQFLVSKNSILSHKIETYINLKELLIKGENDKNNIAIGKTNDESMIKICAPFSAWILERFWKILFDEKIKTIYD